MLEHFLLHIFNVLVLYHILNCGGVFSMKFSPPINFVHPWLFCMNTSVIDAWANNTKKIIYWETQNNTNNPLYYGGIIKSNTNKFMICVLKNKNYMPSSLQNVLFILVCICNWCIMRIIILV